jgi:Domain of unknown function (DUF3885)
VNLRYAIEHTFEGKAFDRPLFHSYRGGLRFDLSEPGAPLDQVLLALQKARQICADVFESPNSLTACLRLRAAASRFGHRETILELRDAGIVIPSERSIWIERVDEEDWFDEGVEEWWLNVAFQAPLVRVQNFLWCAFSTDFGCISPRPGCHTYLFNLERGVMVFPYDDRGMDIVGSNHDLLSMIFQKHRKFLLAHDMPTMSETFEGSNE